MKNAILNFLYKNYFTVYLFVVISLVIAVHSLLWLVFLLLNGPVPSFTFMISYIIVITTLVLFIFGKGAPERFRNKILKKIEKLEQKEKLKNLL